MQCVEGTKAASCVKQELSICYVTTVEPEFYDTLFYDHLPFTTSFSGTDDL